uniref:C2H2-type domain-containing protein n=1 Tax=Anopheles aquasalis TaxID=42839 RepID=T1DQZ7_ANOAQ
MGCCCCCCCRCCCEPNCRFYCSRYYMSFYKFYLHTQTHPDRQTDRQTATQRRSKDAVQFVQCLTVVNDQFEEPFYLNLMMRPSICAIISLADSPSQ